MCGPHHDDPSRTRGGALAVLTPPRSRSPSPPSSPSSFSSVRSTGADLYFHTPGAPAARFATHIRLRPEDADALRDARLRVIVHASGDLTSSADACGILHEFELGTYGTAVWDDGVVELALPESVAIEVGTGVVGRRVSLVDRAGFEGDVVVGEGIIGFNF